MVQDSDRRSGPLYPNQPLVEVAVEVRFAAELLAEAQRPAFQAQVRDEYPRLLLPGAQGGVAPPFQHYRFEKDDESAGVQIAVNSFSCYSRQYPGASGFISETTRLFGLFWELVPELRINRVGWRYINAIPFIRESVSIPLSNYFTQDSIFGTGIHDNYTQVSLKAVYGDDPDAVSVRLGSAVAAASPEEEALILDIDCSVTAIKDGSHVPKAVSDLHDRARGVFEEIISEQYRCFLRGDDDE